MKYLILSQGKQAIIDDEDFEFLNQRKWSFRSDGYAVGRDKGKLVRLHRFIMRTPNGMLTDHINGDRLDNRKSNLRICNDLQNCWNRHSKAKNFSGVQGVYWNKSLKKWRAKITVNRKHIHIGLYELKEDAIKARQKAEIKYFGEYSALAGLSQ